MPDEIPPLEIQDIIQQWDPVIRAVVAACHGNERAGRELAPYLHDVEQEEDWRNLVLTIRRIMQGERGVNLLEDLDPVDTIIVRRIMLSLGLPLTGDPSSGMAAGNVPSPSSAQGEGRDEGSLTLEGVLSLVIAGAQGDQQAREQASHIAQVLEQNLAAPLEARALGQGLQNILEGLRGEDAVQGLPPEAAELVRLIQAQLE